jgi:CRP-like cAMP-binding protein
MRGLRTTRRFERDLKKAQRRGKQLDKLWSVVERLPIEFQYADVERACLGVSRPTISRALGDLRKAGKIECIKRGRDATWRKIEPPGTATP